MQKGRYLVIKAIVNTCANVSIVSYQDASVLPKLIELKTLLWQFYFVDCLNCGQLIRYSFDLLYNDFKWQIIIIIIGLIKRRLRTPLQLRIGSVSLQKASLCLPRSCAPRVSCDPWCRNRRQSTSKICHVHCRIRSTGMLPRNASSWNQGAGSTSIQLFAEMGDCFVALCVLGREVS